ncbi:MAG: FadR family transcriptional regulator [Anaerolineaceae bacterium]|jgi:DNA-binding FadR family transcriptional regulator|nr:MAG: FadR family transcriptional regulator [Anaerolineaceae bacterium]
MLEQYFNDNQRKLLQFIILRIKEGRDDLPPIQELSEQLEMSVPTLREQIEALKMLGLLDARPRHGLHIRPIDISTGLRQIAIIAASIDMKYFYQFSDFRDRLEQAWFVTAAEKLVQDDIDQLEQYVINANAKLHGNPIQIPHREHKELHLSIYQRLDNLFVMGILNTYWTLYEAVGMNLYTDLNYQNKVWEYHSNIVEEIKRKDYQKGLLLLNEHMKLLYKR